MGTKFPELTELTSLASGDVLAVVDVSDTTDSAEGTSKRITAANVATGLASIGAFALDSELSAHEADTTSVHGIADTSALYRAGGTDVAAADGGTGVSTAAANRIFAGPATGADAAPAFRALVSADIPNNAADTSGNAATATLAATATVANSGDSATAFFSSGTIEAARLGSGTPGSGNFLRGDSAWTALAAVATSGSASDLASGTVPSARLGSGGAGAGGKVLADNQTFIDLPAAGVGGSTGSVSDYVLCSSGTGGSTLKACNAATVLDAPLTVNVDNATDGGALTVTRKDIPGSFLTLQARELGTSLQTIGSSGDLQLKPGGGSSWAYVNGAGIKLRTASLGASVYLESTARAAEFKVSDGSSGLGSAWIGGARWGVVTKTANYTATQFDYVILVDATAGAVTITLPAIATANRGQEIRVKKVDSSGNAVTIGRTGADTIDGATTSTLATQYLTRDFVAPDSGVDWAAF